MKALKCPHCDGLILLKIPVSIEIKDMEITKRKATACPDCKGKKEVNGKPCQTCDGVGVVPASKPKNDKPSKEATQAKAD
jgi:DnaJ-class molecular chaperone